MHYGVFALRFLNQPVLSQRLTPPARVFQPTAEQLVEDALEDHHTKLGLKLLEDRSTQDVSTAANILLRCRPYHTRRRSDPHGAHGQRGIGRLPDRRRHDRYRRRRRHERRRSTPTV